MSITGCWNVDITAPIGTQSVVLDLTEDDGIVAGFARGKAETTPLLEPVLDGDRLTWKQVISKPMKLKLTFDVTIDGDKLAGTAKAGALLSSKVTGRRAPAGASA